MHEFCLIHSCSVELVDTVVEEMDRSQEMQYMFDSYVSDSMYSDGDD